MSDIKQVIVIRKDLKMRRGKEIAQGSHASIAWLTSRMTMLGYVNPGETGKYANCHLTEPEWRWIEGNFRKVCCVVQSEQELLDLAAKAKEAQLVCEVIEDTGLTEFGGVPTLTALAIGPDYDEKIDPVTGDLKLYLRRAMKNPGLLIAAFAFLLDLLWGVGRGAKFSGKGFGCWFLSLLALLGTGIFFAGWRG